MSAAVLTPSAAAPGNGVLRSAALLVRTLAALGLAAAITFTLFMLMQALIASDAPPRAEAEELPDFTIAYIPPDETVRPPRTPPEVEPIEAPPPAPVSPVDTQPQPVENSFTTAPPVIDPEAVMSGIDRIAMPPPPLDTRVEPVYPRQELTRGVQGDCTIQYNILASGQTANVRVLACDSRGFERASLEAVARWRHTPVRGEAPDRVIRSGVMTTLSFRLQD